MSELVYSSSSRYILFESSVVADLNRWRQDEGNTEAGGILIGYRRENHLQVTLTTSPFPKDKRSRFRFFRQDAIHQKTAISYWKKTNSKGYYLGEWHSHPQDFPVPSAIDTDEWRKLAESSLGPDLLFLIVGRKDWYLQLGPKMQKLVLLAI